MKRQRVGKEEAGHCGPPLRGAGPGAGASRQHGSRCRVGGRVGHLWPPQTHSDQSRGGLHGRYFLFCPSHNQSAGLCHLCLQFRGRRKWMVTEKAKARSGLKRLARSSSFQTWASGQSPASRTPPARTLRTPQPIRPQGGGLTSMGGPDWKNPPAKQPLVFPAHLH